MIAMRETRQCSAKTLWRLCKSLEIRGPAFHAVEDELEREQKYLHYLFAFTDYIIIRSTSEQILSRSVPSDDFSF